MLKFFLEDIYLTLNVSLVLSFSSNHSSSLIYYEEMVPIDHSAVNHFLEGRLENCSHSHADRINAV